MVRRSAILTPREIDVLRLIAKGLTTKEIAAMLGITRATVAWHIVNITDKLGVSNRAQAAAVAVERSLLRGSSTQA